ncbi:MAG TPA: Gfo/Idh/MocA family oxidoreductase [Pyrinomonadaceae bacterium]|jgi:myo-inositol 2-dehydrogenase/D-chiro-inositol 1-dehydrogenase|nr:Gfo/Idh/MocA family oxidoreductase [Pyrinomonadaceae bacterium]
MDKIKIGIIGAGYIAGVHASVLARDERVGITSVYDVDDARAEQLARTTGAQVAPSSDDLIAACDAVYITTPNTQHTGLAVAAARAGKHVFCEKPMATNLDDAQTVLDAARAGSDSGDAKVFQVGHNRRFAPVYQKLKELISEEQGRPHSAHLKMNRGELINPVWVGDAAITGGFLYETTIHMFDMMRFLFGEVAELYAVGSTHEYPETDDFSVVVRFRNGMHATLCSSSDASWLFPFERVEVFAHHATYVTREMESISQSTGIEGHHVTHSMQQLSREEKWGYLQEDRAFLDSILAGTKASVTALDGYKSVELVDACYRSVQSGEHITFSIESSE